VVEHDDDDEIAGTAGRVHARLHGGADRSRVDRLAGVGVCRAVVLAVDRQHDTAALMTREAWRWRETLTHSAPK
jgi:hypothetical protein